MEKFKVLAALVILAIINPAPKHSIYNNQDTQSKEVQVRFYNQLDTIILKKNECKIEVNSTGLSLFILNKEKIQSINSIIDPTVILYINNKPVTARGILVYRSSLPQGVEYFFALDAQKKIFDLSESPLQLTKVGQ